MVTPTTTGTTSTRAVVAMLRWVRSGSMATVSTAVQARAASDPARLRRTVSVVGVPLLCRVQRPVITLFHQQSCHRIATADVPGSGGGVRKPLPVDHAGTTAGAPGVAVVTGWPWLSTVPVTTPRPSPETVGPLRCSGPRLCRGVDASVRWDIRSPDGTARAGPSAFIGGRLCYSPASASLSSRTLTWDAPRNPHWGPRTWAATSACTWSPVRWRASATLPTWA